jgi:opacity protein-like surface antigen
MKSRYIVTLAAVCSCWSLAAYADRDTGWEFGGELIYQDSQDISGDNGSTAEIDSDVGLALTFGYRVNERLVVNFGLDWNNVDYQAFLVSGDLPNLSATVDGELESFTPRVGVDFNFMEGPITPYVNATIGYSFIDTNIPDGPPQTGCWWDPWYGQICGTWQSTRSVEEFVYGAGLGVRWDTSDTLSVKLEYHKRWIDASDAGSPDFDQLKLGVVFMY